jgi:hypothetical protein
MQSLRQPRGVPLAASPDVHLHEPKARRPGLRVERVAVLRGVGRQHGRLQHRRERRPVVRKARAVRVVQLLELHLCVAHTDRRACTGAAVDQHDAVEILGAGLAVEIPRRVRGRDGAAERMTAEHHFAAELLGPVDDLVKISDGHVHPHWRANATELSGGAWKCGLIFGLVSHPK